MARFTYTPSGVCSRQIFIEIENNMVKDVSYIGGCNGNLKGIAALVKGMSVNDVIARLKGVDCGGKGTSCPDQLARALEMTLNQ